MKRVINVLLTAVLIVASLFTFVACNGAPAEEAGAKGLLLKKINGTWTIYDYVVEDETLSVLDIGSILTNDLSINEEYNIKAGAFEGNDTLTKIIVSNKVNVIEKGAFRNMQILQTLDVPFVGESVYADAYYAESSSSTDNGKAINEERTMAHFFGNEAYDAGREVTIDYGANVSTCYVPVTFNEMIITATKGGKVIDDKEVYSIPMHAFDGATNLQKITLQGDKLYGIGEFAFNGCVNLKNVTIPSTVKTVYASAFAGCSKLESVTLNTVTDLVVKDSAFEGCSKIKNFNSTTLNQVDLTGVKSIGEKAFNFGSESVNYLVVNAGTLDLQSAFFKQAYTK